MTEIEEKRANAQKALEALKLGKGRLLTKGWCQYAYARGAYGLVVPTVSPDAMSFCALGACMTHRDGPGEPAPFKEYLEKALRLRGSDHFWVPPFNDHPDTTKEDVLSLFDEAIVLAEKEAQ